MRRNERHARVDRVASVTTVLLLACVVLCGCSWRSPLAYASRGNLQREQVTPTLGVMYGSTPHSFDSSFGTIRFKSLEWEGPLLSKSYEEVFEVSLPTPQPARLTCAHEPAGTAYPPGFEFVGSGAFGCLGAIGETAVRVAVDRGCYEGMVSVGAERYRLVRGNITVAGSDFPSDEVSLLDEQGALVAAFDIYSITVWSRPTRLGDATTKIAPLVIATAMHHWVDGAQNLKRDACR